MDAAKTLREMEKAGFQPKIMQATELSQEAAERLEDLKAEIKELAESNAEKREGREVGHGFNSVGFNWVRGLGFRLHG